MTLDLSRCLIIATGDCFCLCVSFFDDLCELTLLKGNASAAVIHQKRALVNHL